MREIYFDNSATTRICPAALQAYVEASEQHYGNPSSRHARGQDAAAVLRRARQTICSGIGAADGELIFVASGSEANNLAILGRAYAKQRFRGGRLLTSEGEHSSVNEPLARLEEQGFTIAHIPTLGGALDMDALAAAGGDDVILVSLMLVNNETGALYDIPRAARIIRRCCPNALLHCDATQGYMKVPFTVRSLGVDLLTLSAHKIEGPKGMGALWVAPGVLGSRGIVPLVYGGGQERDSARAPRTFRARLPLPPRPPNNGTAFPLAPRCSVPCVNTCSAGCARTRGCARCRSICLPSPPRTFSR